MIADRPPHRGAAPTSPARSTGSSDELAATFLDGSLMSDGIYVPDGSELRLLVERTHAAGGLYVADEVQAGYGRIGRELWSFTRHGIVPDIVTLGKPMGNGYPVAAVVTRRELAERFPYAGRTFSTFGGNPVAAAAALAVLDVLEDERLPERRRGRRQRACAPRSRASARRTSSRCEAAVSSPASSSRAASSPHASARSCASAGSSSGAPDRTKRAQDPAATGVHG